MLALVGLFHQQQYPIPAIIHMSVMLYFLLWCGEFFADTLLDWWKGWDSFLFRLWLLKFLGRCHFLRIVTVNFTKN
jgi:hypothetical protein